MKYLNQKRNVFNSFIETLQGHENDSTSLINLKDDNTIISNLLLQVTALLLTLSTITALLLVWFEIK